MQFTSIKSVRFHHCDPAGIVFYPQYLVLCHEVIEDWINHGLQVGFSALLRERRLGTPTVKLACDFVKRSSFGDLLNFDLSVGRLGTASFSLNIHAHSHGESRLRVVQTLVVVDLQTFKAVPIPDDLRSKMVQYLDIENVPNLSGA